MPGGDRAQAPRGGANNGDRAVVFGRNEEHRVDVGDGLLERARHWRVVSIEVWAVERQVLDGDLGQRQFGWREPHQGLREQPVDGRRREAANEISDFVRGHARLLDWVGWFLLLPDAWKAEHPNGGNSLYALGYALTRRERQAAQGRPELFGRRSLTGHKPS